MKSSVRFVLALGAFFVAAGALAACGGIPGNSVAKVDDTTIKKATFDHWMVVAAKSSQQPGAAAPAAVPDPPDYTKCVAAARKALPAPAKGQKPPTDAQLRNQCKQQYGGLRDQVMQFLINAEWLRGEAKDQGVKVSQAEITKSYNQQKAQQFPKPAAFAAFLKQTGMTVPDLRLNVEVSLLSTKIRNKVTKGTGTVTPAQIAAYYNKNKSQFAQPETRQIDLLLTKTQPNAKKALAALKSGDDFKAVTKQYSVDPATKRQGGRLTVTKGQQDPSFDKAVFGAPKGKLVGPVKTQFGYSSSRSTRSRRPGSRLSRRRPRRSASSSRPAGSARRSSPSSRTSRRSGRARPTAARATSSRCAKTLRSPRRRRPRPPVR